MKKKILLIIIVTILQTFTSFAQTNIYNVRLSDIINTTTPCGPTVRYQFVGAGDWGFRWTSSETSMAKSITVELNYAINCNSNSSNNSVKLNGVNQAVQPTPGPYNCQCVPPGASPTVWTLNPSDYNSGGLNTVLLKSIGNSEGLNLLTGSTDVYARVTVKYSDTTIKGLATSIRNGDTTPAVADDTEFGSVAESAPLNHTFTIGNASTNNLTLTGTPSVAISGSNAFSIVTQPASTTIAGGSSNTFIVRFAPACAALGVQTAIVSVATDDPDASIYKFTVQGTGIDNLAPTIVTNGDKNVNVNPGGCEATVTVSATATDNCSVGTPTGVRSDAKLLSDVYPVGTTTITWNVTDVNGNHGVAAIQNVIVNDNILPTAISKNITVQLNASGSVTVNATQLNDGSTDNCGINNYKFAYGSVGTVCNVVGEGAFLSLTAPTASVFKNILYASYGNSTGTCGNFVTGSCNASNSLSVVSSALINKNSGSIYSSNDIFGDPCNGTQKRLAVQARYAPSTTETASLTFSCADVGTHNVVLFVTDSNGNVSTANATITVNDDTVPLITSNGDQNLNADAALCTTNVSVSASATDNCNVGTPKGVRSDAKLLSDVYPVGITTIAWNVKDSNGNDAVEVIQTVTVTDNQIPVITSNGDQNVNADAGLCGAIVVVSASATDNCSVGTPTGVRNDGKLLSDFYPVGSTEIKWNVKDSNGNDAVEVIQTVIVTDNQIPVITSNGDQNVNADAGLCGAIVVVSASATDNCSVGTPTGIRNDGKLLSEVYPVGSTEIKWNVKDSNANDAVEVIQTVTVEDKILPTVITKNITVQLDATGNATIVASDIDDSSSDNCGIDILELNITSFTCANIGPNTVKLKVTDKSGNVDIKDAIVTVEDKIAPTVLAKNIIVQLDASGVVTIQAADVDNGSTDICGTLTLTVSPDTFTCANIGNNTVTLTATDAKGNTSSQTATVKVENNIVPNVLTKNITVQLNATGNVSIVPADIDNGSTYACGNPTLTVSPNTFTCANVGANVVTLTATDAYGNVSTKTATVTIQDKIAATALAKDLTVQLDATGNATITATQIDNGSTDLCGIASVTVNPNTFSCNNVGPNSVTLTVTDVNGNKSTATATVTVQDNILPIAKTKDLMVELDDAGNVSITAAQINNASSDNCSIATVTLDKLSFNCTNVGVNTVVLTVKDKAGNTATATAKVTVVNKAGDNDNDGIPDNCDNDDDNDGVSDTSDNCPITANPHQEDRNNNGIGDACDKDQLNISQAFTPNGDGINDTWVISNIENHPNSVVRVFNRWGAEVFTARNYQNDWDGHYKGNSSSLPDSSSYYYQIDLDGDGSIDKEGWIYINR